MVLHLHQVKFQQNFSNNIFAFISIEHKGEGYGPQSGSPTEMERAVDDQNSGRKPRRNYDLYPEASRERDNIQRRTWHRQPKSADFRTSNKHHDFESKTEIK